MMNNMKRFFPAVMACFFMMLGLVHFAAAADPVPTVAGDGNPTSNGWTGK